jgi:hypothetical protein
MTDFSNVTLQGGDVALIQCALLGANQIVAAVPGQRIRVISFRLSASAAVNAKWQSAANDLTGLAYYAANGGEVVPPIGHTAGTQIPGWFETNLGEALNLNLSAAVAVGGSLVYALVS